MKKIAQLMKDHIEGKQTQASKKAISKIESKLKESGFKPPFQFKMAIKHGEYEFETNMPDDTPIIVTYEVSEGYPGSYYEPPYDDSAEIISVVNLETGEEIPEIAWKYMDLEEKALIEHGDIRERRRSEWADIELDRIKDRKMEEREL